MNEYRSYPRMKYHATQGICAVFNQEQELALGESWGDSPAESKSLKEITFHEAISSIHQNNEAKLRTGKK